MVLVRTAFVWLLVVALFSEAQGDSVLWTTGTARTINYDFIVFRTYSGFGYVSGYSDETMPQRWAAVPFRLNQPSRITQLEAYYSNPNRYATNVGFRIWNRTNLEAPTTVVATRNLGPYVAVADEELAASNPALHLHQHPVDVMLPAGDYYLSIFAMGPAWIAWWTGGGLQDSSLESNFIWRSAAFPSPGFQPWTYSQSSNLLADPRDVYNLAFTLRGTGAGPGDFNLDGAVDGGDFLAWQRARGSSDWRSDGNRNGVVDGEDLAIWKESMSSSAASASIPEPPTRALAVILLATLACLTSRRTMRLACLALMMIGPDPTVRAGVLPFTMSAPEQSLSPLLDGLISPGEYKSSVVLTYADSANAARFIPAMVLDYDGTDADLSATFYAAHTSTSLFLAFRVLDDVLDAEPGQFAFRNDSIEIVIDGDRASNDFGSYAIIGGSPEGFQLIADSAGQKYAQGVGADEWSVATSAFADGYVIEFMLPLNLIDTADGPDFSPAQTGDILRFNGSLTDNDRPVDGQDNFGLFWLEEEWFALYGTNYPSPFILGEDVWAIDLELTPLPEPSPLLLCGLTIPALVVTVRWLARVGV